MREEVLQAFDEEGQRVKALEDWFGIVMTEGEKKGISGAKKGNLEPMPSEQAENFNP